MATDIDFWITGVCVLAVQSVRESLETMHLYVPTKRKDKGFPADGSLPSEQWKLPYYETFLPAKEPVTIEVPNYETRKTVEKDYVAKDRVLIVSFSRCEPIISLARSDEGR